MPLSAPVTGEAALRFESLPPLSLYIHLPWCVRKCPYCDFNSYEGRGALPEDKYVNALLVDLRSELPAAQRRSVQTVFIGGGTPSLFSGRAIARLLDGVRASVELAPGAEITLEANPGAADAARFGEFRDAGVNRLSIGVQSFRNEQLRALGRVHDAAEAVQAFEAARASGFDNINLDLMYGLPGDDVDGSLGDLKQALTLAPAHLSWYQLTLEPSTAFARRPPALPDEAVVATVEAKGRELLAAEGFVRYEVSAYARPERRSAHNLNYWGFGDYLGIGAGAHGKITWPAEQTLERRAKTRNPRTYEQQAGTGAAVTREHIAIPSQTRLEFLLNALRLLDGVSLEQFVARAGQSAAGLDAPRAVAVERGWLVDEPAWLRATPAGFERLNRVLELFA